jgi:hypothetical protein
MGNEKYKDTFEAVVEIDETYVGGKQEKRTNIQINILIRNLEYETFRKI